jgi:hypothetical protein
MLMKRNKSIGNMTKIFVKKNNEIKEFKKIYLKMLFQRLI